VLMPGVISHATNVVEHPELVCERIVRIAQLVGRENTSSRVPTAVLLKDRSIGACIPASCGQNSKPWSGGSACQPGALALMPIG